MNKDIKTLVGRINTEAVLSNGNSMYLDGNRAYELIADYSAMLVAFTKESLAENVVNIESIDNNPKRGPGRPPNKAA